MGSRAKRRYVERFIDYKIYCLVNTSYSRINVIRYPIGITIIDSGRNKYGALSFVISIILSSNLSFMKRVKTMNEYIFRIIRKNHLSLVN